MTINFVSNFQNGYVGEVGDATHLARELEALGHTVRKIPQDEWREWVREYPNGKYKNVPSDMQADINLITKWHHFYDGSFIQRLRTASYGAPVFYWVWDYMQKEEWHMKMVHEADLYLGNDTRSGCYRFLDNCYYFPFDVADGNLPFLQLRTKQYDVSFFGSWIGQGERQKYLNELVSYIPLKVFSWNHQDWPKNFDVSPAVYGEEFNKAVANSKIVLGFSVEPSCWGYWSNRVGKVLLAGGFLLYQYAPGMELFLRDGAEYFSDIDELKEKIDHYLVAGDERDAVANRGREIGQRFSSKARVGDLGILMERYLKTGGLGWKV